MTLLSKKRKYERADYTIHASAAPSHNEQRDSTIYFKLLLQEESDKIMENDDSDSNDNHGNDESITSSINDTSDKIEKNTIG